MTEIILSFPVRGATRLSCVWFETGNAAQPLACKWIAIELAGAEPESASATKPLTCRLCA